MKVILLIIIFLSPSFLQAQHFEILTLEKAHEIALKNNREIKSLQMAKESASEELNISKSSVLPRIDISETFNVTNSPSMVFTHKLNQEQFTKRDFDINSLNNPQSRSNWNTRIEFSQPVFNSGREFININISRENLKIHENFQKIGTNKISYSVESLFYLAVLTRDAINVLENAKKAAKLSEELAIKRNERGIALKSDVLSAQVNLSQIEKELIKAKNDHKIALSHLNYIMGVELDKSYNIQFDTEKIYGQKICDDIDTCMEIALKNRPEISIKKSFNEIARQKKREARFDYLPNLNIKGSYNLNSEDPIKAEGNSWDLMVLSSFNIFSGGEKSSRLKSALAQEQKTEYELNNELEKIKLEIREALFDIDTSEKHIDVMAKTIKQAEETLRIIKERYNNGLSLMVELISAETSFKDANLNYIKAIYDHRLAILKLKLMTGNI